MNLSITHEEAKFAHQDYFSDDFEVIQITRSGLFDAPPFSFFYGLSDIGSWDGLMSTDGSKIVVTKVGYIDLKKVKEVYVFNKSDIDTFNVGVFKTTIGLKNKIKGLTKQSTLKAILILFGSILYILPGILVWKFMPSKILFQYRPENKFKNLDQFNELLK